MSIICVSIGELSFEEALEVVRVNNFVEIRLDLLGESVDYKKLISLAKMSIVTYRPSQNESTNQRQLRLDKIKDAILAGASFVDIEIESENNYINELREFAHKNGCKVIISYHNFQNTPTLKELQDILLNARTAQADIVKVATQVTRKKDNLHLLSLLTNSSDLVVIGMGEQGKLVRAMAPYLGSKFTFAAVDKKRATAPGQLTVKELREVYQALENIGVTLKDE